MRAMSRLLGGIINIVAIMMISSLSDVVSFGCISRNRRRLPVKPYSLCLVNRASEVTLIYISSDLSLLSIAEAQ